MNAGDDFLAAYRAVCTPPSDRRARNFAGLQQRIALHAEPPLPVAVGRTPWARAAAMSVGIAAAVLLVVRASVGGWVALRGPQDQAPVQAPRVLGAPNTGGRARAATLSPTHAGAGSNADATATPTDDAVAPDPAVPNGATTETTDPTPTLPRAAGRHAGPTPAGPSDPIDELEREVALLRDARAALKAGDLARLWQLTERHATEHPGGALAPERDAWRALAACRLHRADAASLFGDFLAQHPESAHRARVVAACEIQPQ